MDPAHYGGWSGDLTGCEPDARDMHAIAQARGLTSSMLLTSAATRSAVLSAITTAAQDLVANDLYVLSYSGHGGQVPDGNGDDAADGLDETWCLFDGELIDDEIYGALSGFRPGVRVLVFSDSCHSGTVVKVKKGDFGMGEGPRTQELLGEWKKANEGAVVRPKGGPGAMALRSRAAPPDVLLRTFHANRDLYERLGRDAPKDARAAVQCHVILISGCGDPQLSADLGTNGLFTRVLKEVWDGGAFAGSHKAFHAAVRDGVKAENPSQVPEYFIVGAPIPGYEDQRPYTLTTP